MAYFALIIKHYKKTILRKKNRQFLQLYMGLFTVILALLYAYLSKIKVTVVVDNINIMKTTFELNFNFYQVFKQHGYTKIWKQREDVNLKSFTLNTCKLVIRKKPINN